MNNNIRVYDNIIPPDFCDNIVNKFEANSNQWQSESSSSYDFTQIDMGRHRTSWQEETGELLNLLFPCVSKYKEDINPMWPNKHGFELPRIKRYLPNGTDEFRKHVDVTDYKNAKRFLVFFVYLTDNEAGQTIINDDFVSPCRKGSVLMFPPLWTHPHAGMQPVNTPKYIVGSYLHYI